MFAPDDPFQPRPPASAFKIFQHQTLVLDFIKTTTTVSRYKARVFASDDPFQPRPPTLTFKIFQHKILCWQDRILAQDTMFLV